MGTTEIAVKGLRLVYVQVKWTPGAVFILIFTALVYSLRQQWYPGRSSETGMTRARVIGKPGEPRLELEEPGFCNHGSWLAGLRGSPALRGGPLPALEVWCRHLAGDRSRRRLPGGVP